MDEVFLAGEIEETSKNVVLVSSLEFRRSDQIRRRMRVAHSFSSLFDHFRNHRIDWTTWKNSNEPPQPSLIDSIRACVYVYAPPAIHLYSPESVIRYNSINSTPRSVATKVKRHHEVFYTRPLAGDSPLTRSRSIDSLIALASARNLAPSLSRFLLARASDERTGRPRP